MQGLAPGVELAGYVLEAELGRGGMGIVYAARQVSLGRRVALKVLAPELSEDPRFVARFKAESRLAASVEHPNVVPVYEAGEDDGLLFIAMRFVPGTDLRALLHGEERLEPERALDLLDQIAAGLDAVHAAGLVHRDVKPANVLVTEPDEVAYLTDFGLARQAASQTTGLTDTGLVMGTPDYMSPEQLNAERVDARSDIYSLAALLFHLLEGRPPFGGRDLGAKMYGHIHLEPPRLRVDVPGELDDVIQRGMAKEPAARYPSAGDLAIAARAAVEGLTARLRERTVATGEAAPPEASAVTKQLRRGPPRRRTLALAAAAAVAAGAAVGLTLSAGTKHHSDAGATEPGTPALVASPSSTPSAARRPHPQTLPTPPPLGAMRARLASAGLSPAPLVPTALPRALIGTKGKTEVSGARFTLTFQRGCCTAAGGSFGYATFGRSPPGALDADLRTAESRGSPPTRRRIAGHKVYYLCGHVCGYEWVEGGFAYHAFGLYYEKPGSEKQDLAALVRSVAPLPASTRPISLPGYLSAGQVAQLRLARYAVLLPPRLPLGWLKPAVEVAQTPAQGRKLGLPVGGWALDFTNADSGLPHSEWVGGNLFVTDPKTAVPCRALPQAQGHGPGARCGVFRARGVSINHSQGASGDGFFWTECGTDYSLSWTVANVSFHDVQRLINALVVLRGTERPDCP